MSAEIALDVCTPEGKTWLARITATGGTYGVEREFQRYVSADLSRSGRLTRHYVVGDGVYESNEGRKRYGRRYWIVEGDQVTEVDRSDAIRQVEGKS